MIKLKEFTPVKSPVFFLLICSLYFSCQSSDRKVQEKEEDAEIAQSRESEEWNQLFIRNQGWFGGDGIFGIPMDGKEFVPAGENTVTLFTFGDTMIGNHDGNVLDTNSFYMVNNSVGYLVGNKPDPEKMSFHFDQDERGDPKPLFVPDTPGSEEGDYYWLGDGFVNTEADSTLYIFAYLIHEKDTAGEGGFAFEQIGVNLIAIPNGSQPPFREHIQIETPLFDMGSETSFGSAIYVNTESAGAPDPDGYIYVYAMSKINNIKSLIVGRVLPDSFTDFGDWRFWNGNEWDPEMKNSAALAEHVSNEMSVSPLPDGRILLTYQFMTMGKDVAIQTGSSLTGPFDEMQSIWQTTENDQDKDYFTYNAKAFPHLSAEGEVLLSYNVNSFDFWNDVLNDPTLYRPRFIIWKIE
jgi:hypothetical protein